MSDLKMKVIVIDHTEPIGDAVYRRLLEVVSEEKRARILRMRRRIDRERSLIGDIVVRFAATMALNIPVHHHEFGISSCGKPYLVHHPDFHFNLSHSGRYITFVFAAVPVGIDVEQIAPTSFDVAQMFFSSAEYSDLMSRPEELRLMYFYDLWTIKESYLKLRGEGLSRPLNSFYVENCQNEFDIFRIAGDPNCRIKQYAIDPGYRLSVSAASDDFPDKADLEESDQLCSRFLSEYL
jgi:4'-phosphopantetheinyl transferase